MLSRATLLCVLLCIACSLPAAEPGSKTKQTVALTQPVFEGLKEAQELIEAKQFAAGHKILAGLAKGSDLPAYDTAQIWNLTAYAYYLQEKYKNAIGAYLRVLKQEDLPEALVQSTLKTLSQLYFTTEDYAKALTVVDRLIEVVASPSPDILMLKGQAHFQLEQYEAALKPIKTAIGKYREQGKRPQENWLLLLRVCYFQLNDFPNMLVVLKDLIRLYPKTQYLRTLSGVYSELGDTKKQLAITEALYEAGYVDDANQIVNLANLYLLHGVPYKAAKVLAAETDSGRVEASERHLRLLSQAWYQAREDIKAIDPLLRAARMSADGELYLRLAQSYINLARWDEATESVQKALDKGGLKRGDTANIMLGMALFNQRKLAAARKAFELASRDRRSAAAAKQWMAYVDSELKRDKTLGQVVPERERREEDEILKNL